MGQGNSIEDPTVRAAVQKLSKVELKDLESVYLELSTLQSDQENSGIQQPTWLNRDHFAKVFGTNEFLIEQFFEAFDRDKNGFVDMQEFVCGMALCLHGSIKAKCALLFKVFNLDGDEGVSPEELTAMLTSCLQSAESLLRQTLKSEKLTFDDEYLGSQAGEAIAVSVLVERLVKDAFTKCDVSGNGKLEIEEFEQWVHKNPKLMNNLFVLQCPKPSFHINSVTSEYSVINENEGLSTTNQSGNNGDNGDVFHDAHHNLESNTEEGSKSQLQSLFGGESTTGATIFDNIGKDVAEKTKPLPRPQSDQCIADHFNESTPCHGVSENDILSLPSQTIQHHETSQSLHSIALSRDSLLNVEQHVDSTSETSLSQTSTNNSAEQIWHPLQTPKEVSSDVDENAQENDTPADEPTVPQQDVHEGQYQGMEQGVEAIDTPLEPSMNEITRRMVSYWHPNYQTEQLLLKASQGNPVEEKFLTSPCVLVEGTMGDPIKELVNKYLGEQEANKRNIPLPHEVSFTEEGLRELLRAGCWRGAIDFTSKFLTAHGHGLDDVQNTNYLKRGMTASLMQIWFVRIALLMKMKMFSSAEAELNAFNDFEGVDLCYEFYPHIYQNKKGNMVPFSLRLLYAELPQHNGRPNVALDRLYILKRKVKQVIVNLEKGLLENGSSNDIYSEDEIKECLELWVKRGIQLEYSLGNCFLGMKEYNLAAKIYEGIVVIDPTKKISILSAIGRIYVQLGDLKTASSYFDNVVAMVTEDANDKSILAVNEGYMELANGNYDEAYQKFLAASSVNPDNISCFNNAAVCLLFLGRVKEASSMLEKLVWKSPELALHEDILLNLNTIYELESSRALQKKQKILHLVSNHKGDGFFTQCLKLT